VCTVGSLLHSQFAYYVDQQRGYGHQHQAEVENWRREQLDVHAAEVAGKLERRPHVAVDQQETEPQDY